jgi:putative transposase
MPAHVILRANNRRRLFSYPRDYRQFAWLLDRAASAMSCPTHALCLMANHVHKLTTPPAHEDLSACIKSYAQVYAQRRNRERGGSGKLFEERYYSKLVTSDIQFVLTTFYIEANPLRAGLVDDALAYPWSTHAFHAGEPTRSALHPACWKPSRWYLSLGDTPAQRALVYRKRFDDYLEAGRQPDHADEVAQIETRSAKPYRRRLLRPNGSRASE